MESICKKCGRPLSRGELRYQVTIQVTSMFDGFMEIPEGDMEEEMERIIEAVRRHDPEELEKRCRSDHFPGRLPGLPE